MHEDAFRGGPVRARWQGGLCRLAQTARHGAPRRRGEPAHMSKSLLERCASRATRLPRAAKAWIAFTTDLLAMPVALFVTLALKRGTPADAAHVPLTLYIAAAMLPAGVLAAFRTYHAVFRFISSGVLFRSSLAVLVS